MSVRSASFLNATLVPPPLSSSNSSIYSLYIECVDSFESQVIYTVLTCINILLFPLYTLVLYIGFHQRAVPARTTRNHSDIFTYHIVFVEILGVFGSVFYSLGYYTNSLHLLILGVNLFMIIFPGQTLFHCLTCFECYLAVVHPITYLGLRETRGVRIRNISIACVWLLCFGWMGMKELYLPNFPTIPLLTLIGSSIIVTLFCCISVLHVLTHPKPGEVGGNKERVDQLKQRAFRIILTIMGMLLLRFVVLFVTFGVQKWLFGDFCWLLDAGLLLTLPSSLILPLLFLHRTGKLACCRHNTESE